MTAGSLLAAPLRLGRRSQHYLPPPNALSATTFPIWIFLYGLTTVDVRRLAYDLAEKLGLKHNFSAETKMAGRDWLRGFFKRHEDLAIRRPQAQCTNVARAVRFNRPKVHQFFELYRSQLEMSIYTSARIWNMDETGVTNVQKPGKIVATKGVRQVGKMTSGERGATVTVICGMNAVGTYLPPMFIFPRKRMVASLMIGAPYQSVGYPTAGRTLICL